MKKKKEVWQAPKMTPASVDLPTVTRLLSLAKAHGVSFDNLSAQAAEHYGGRTLGQLTNAEAEELGARICKDANCPSEHV